MNRGQVFVRARTKEGGFASIDVFDLDDESFRAFVLTALCRLQAVHSLVEPDGEPIELKERA